MVTEIVFRFQPSLLGSFDQPQPPINHLAGVIVLQRGQALVGRWDAEICGFMHPANQRELAAEALTAILESYPEADLTSSDMRFFTCPEPLATRMDFENW